MTERDPEPIEDEEQLITDAEPEPEPEREPEPEAQLRWVRVYEGGVREHRPDGNYTEDNVPEDLRGKTWEVVDIDEVVEDDPEPTSDERLVDGLQTIDLRGITDQATRDALEKLIGVLTGSNGVVVRGKPVRD